MGFVKADADFRKNITIIEIRIIYIFSPKMSTLHENSNNILFYFTKKIKDQLVFFIFECFWKPAVICF